MSIKFLLLGEGGVIWVLGGGGGSADFMFMGARIFLIFGRGVIREVFLPPLFSTPPCRPLTYGFCKSATDVSAAKILARELDNYRPISPI